MSGRPRRNRAAAVVLCAIPLLGSLLYFPFWTEAPVMASDSAGYLLVSQDLADGSLDKLHFRPPGYPVVLALTGSFSEPTRGVFFASLLFHGLTVALLVWRLGVLGFRRRTLALFSLLLISPPFLEPATKLLSEPLCGALLTIATVAVLSGLPRTGLPKTGLGPQASERGWRPIAWMIVSGVFFGLAALVKPTYQLVAVLPAAVLWFAPGMNWSQTWPKRKRSVIALAGAFVLLLAAYVGFNAVRFDYPGLSRGNLGYSLSTKTVTVLERLPDSMAVEREAMIEARDAELVVRGSSHTAEQYLPTARRRLREVTDLDEEGLDELFLHTQLMLIAQAPMTYLSKTFRAMGDFWLPSVGAFSSGGSRTLQGVWSLLHFALIGFFFLQLLVIIGWMMLEGSRRLAGRWLSSSRTPRQIAPDRKSLRPEILEYLIPLSVVAYTFLVSTLVHHGEARFRNPVDPLIVFMILVGARVWWRLIVDSPNPDENRVQGTLDDKAAGNSQ